MAENGQVDLATRGDLLALESRLKEYTSELIEHMETKLLKEFRKWAISFESKFKANEALVTGFSERMTSLEERVSDLERGA